MPSRLKHNTSGVCPIDPANNMGLAHLPLWVGLANITSTFEGSHTPCVQKIGCLAMPSSFNLANWFIHLPLFFGHDLCPPPSFWLTEVFYLAGWLQEDNAVVLVVFVAHALVDSPSQVMEIEMGNLRAQLVDEAGNAFKEFIDNSSISPITWKTYFGATYLPQVAARLCWRRECLTLGVVWLANNNGIFQVAHTNKSQTTTKLLQVLLDSGT